MLLAAFLCAAASHATAREQTFASQGGGVSFLTPSNNIACIYTPQGGSATYVPEDGGPELQCDRAEPTYLRFILGRQGKAKELSDVGDQGCCAGTNTLQYGSTWSVAPFSCVSATTGLTCTRGDGHGFFISKAKVKVY